MQPANLSTPKSVLLIAAHPLGLALFAVLQKKSRNIVLFEYPDHRAIYATISRFRLDDSFVESEFHPNFVENLDDAIPQSRLIMVAVPSSDFGSVIKVLCKFDLKEHVILALQGSGFTMLARNAIKPQFSPRFLFETTCQPFDCSLARVDGLLIVHLRNIKQVVEIAASQAVEMGLLATISSFFPCQLKWYADLTAIFVSDIDRILFAPGLFFLACGGRAEDHFFFHYYSSDITNLVLSLDEERRSLAQALDVNSDTVLQILNFRHGTHEGDLPYLLRTSPTFSNTLVPSQDYIRDLLFMHVMSYFVPMHEIGVLCNTPTPIMDRFIEQTGKLFRFDFFKSGWTLSKLGLKNPTRENVRHLLNGDFFRRIPIDD